MTGQLHVFPIKQDAIARLAKTLDPQALDQERSVLAASIVNETVALRRGLALTVSQMQEIENLPDDKRAQLVQASHELKDAIKKLAQSVEALGGAAALFPAKA